MSTPRVLVIGPSWVGDMVMAQSLFQVLQTTQPGVEIDVLAPAWSMPLLARMPQVHQGLEMPLGHGAVGLGVRWRMGRSLRGRYTQAIVLPGSFKSALIPLWAGIARRTAYKGEQRYGLINDMRILDGEQLPLMVQRYVALALDKGAPLPASIPNPRLQVNGDNQRALVQKLGLSADRPAVALVPGAEFGPSKQWPLPHFAAAAKSLVASGHQIWVLGSAKDAEYGRVIAEQAGEGVHNLCGQTRLEDAVDLLAAARAAVTNDSGLMHVAAAVGTPTVALFGSSSPKHTPPLSDKAQVLSLNLECSPCFQRTCPLGHTRCLVDIQPETVLNQLNRMA